MKNKEMKVKAMSMAVAMSMVVGLCPSTIFAATGSQTAKDGTYTNTAHVARTAEDDENEDEWNEYDVEVSLKVEDGKAIFTPTLPEFRAGLEYWHRMAAEGLLVKNHVDCGCILFDAAEQQVKSGGSGPGCCAAVLCGHILPRLLRRSQKRVLFVATGALMSQTTFLQKESIPAVAHLVELRAPEKESGA